MKSNEDRVAGSPELEELSDRSRIIEVLLRFENGARRGDLEMITSVFADDAELDYEGTRITGIADVRRYFAGYLDPEHPARKTAMTFEEGAISTPFLGNVNIIMQGKTALCESSTLATHAGMRNGSAIVLMRAVDDHDQFIFTEDCWKIRRRFHKRLWGFEVPAALGRDDPPNRNDARSGVRSE